MTVDPLALITRATYGYAADNPLNVGDPSGLFFNLAAAALGAVIGGVVGGVVAVATDVFITGDTSHLGADVAGGIVGGAIGGGCIGFSLGLATAICGAVAGGVGEFTTEAIVGNGFNPTKLAITTGLGFIFGGIHDPFPTRGFLPYKFSNVVNPGKNAGREYGNALVKGGATSLITTLVC